MAFNSALIVDDHPLFCDALAMTLESIQGLDMVRTASTLGEAIETLSSEPSVDVIMLDLNLPDVDGLDGLVRLKSVSDVPIVIVSSMSDDRMIDLSLRAGASGYVPKHSRRDVFRDALDRIDAGKTYTPESYVPTEDSDGPSPEDILVRLASLTQQQTRILQEICEGKLNKQIAYDLSIAETTVKAHITAIMRKLGVQSRTQAVLLVKSTSFASVLQDPGPSS